jgi:signal transduction histidine kinase
MGAAAAHIGWELFDIQEESGPDPFIFYRAFDKIEDLAEEIREKGGEKHLEDAVRRFNRKRSSGGIALSVFKGTVPLVESPLPPPPEILDLAFAAENGGLVSTGKSAAYVQKAGPYTLALYNPAFNVQRPEYDTRPELMFTLLLLTIAVIILTVVLYNIVLSWFVLRPIAGTLETLRSGASRIRDGDLEHRIPHTTKDEFLPLCQAFNEMAGRLLESVRSKQKDEESRRELIAGISHDLRTPLTSIKAYAESLAANVADTGEKRAAYLEIIQMKADDMEKIIRQLFLFSKLDLAEFPLNREITGINGELALIIGAIREEFEKTGLDIYLETEETETFVLLDAAQFRNVLYNILDNSRKYRTAERGKALISSRADWDWVFVTISDNGPGVPSGTLERIFEVFYRVDSSRSAGRGSGLGLAITARIMKHLGGNVRAENRPDGGLSIILSLPRMKGEFPAAPVPAALI